MDFGQNLKAFQKKLPLRKMSGHEKFLGVAAFECKGKANDELGTICKKSFPISVAGIIK